MFRSTTSSGCRSVWTRGVRPATSFSIHKESAHQATALRPPPQRTRARECERVHRGRIRNGIGIKPMISSSHYGIPRDAENKHFLIVGDTGSGKSSIIRQMLYQVDARGDSAIVYDPACEFVKQFYDERRGTLCSIRSMPNAYWNPSKELRRRQKRRPLPSRFINRRVTNRFFVEGAAEDIRSSTQLPAHTGGSDQVDVRPRRDRPPRQGNRVLDANRSEGSAATNRRARLPQYER